MKLEYSLVILFVFSLLVVTACSTANTEMEKDLSGAATAAVGSDGNIPSIKGSGQLGYLAKFTGRATIGNSAIYEKVGNVGIGTATPVAKLEVDGGDAIFRNDVYVAQNLASKSVRINGGHLEVMGGGDISVVDLRGSGNAYACIDSNGQLYRSSTPCA